jgi:ferredoxin--NADP+ reductase
MAHSLGTSRNPLRVAVIGSGPSAFYAAEAYLKQTELAVEVDMFERLPTPHGLVRGGVAPDHQKIKSVTKVYDKIAADPRFRFYGNVEFGRDLRRADLVAHYHQIVYATGAQTDRRMGIPGEDLPGSHAATEFVGWYNAHPDYRDLHFDLTQTHAAVIGNGNVAMDVARILARSEAELAATDIADYALEALRSSRVTDIYVFGRRGPAQAAFTNPEIKELGELADADVIVLPEEAALDPLSQEMLAREPDRTAANNVQILQAYAQRAPAGKRRRIHMRFLWSPVELIGTERVEAIRLVKNELQRADDGALRPRATDQTEIIPVGLVFRSIGYKGVALPDVPFDSKAGIIPNQAGRVIDPTTGAPIIGDYVVGWIKRGPSGVIGTNKPDSVESVKMALEDAAAGRVHAPANAERAAVEAMLIARGIEFIRYEDWLMLDRIEQERGKSLGRPRLKFSRVDDMLSAIRAAKSELEPTGD